ncbi:receptor kinase-like protein Xa21 [Nicotiana tomentosiformis]|uniref:receptor kinase-like protein Xa21 n=1 Tax=Nicotiana tomentosiformis TaxID=4098 RepID=UPI00388CDE46
MEKANSFILCVVLQLLYLLVACMATNISTDESALLATNMGIVGTIPPQLGNLSFLVSLDVIDLGYNNFSGEIPMWFGFFSELQILILDNNGFTDIPPASISNLSKSLKEIAISHNPLNDVLPDSISNLSSTSLERFSVYYSEIRGQIPLGIGNLSNLNTLSLFGNALTGSVPRSLCDLQNLQVLALDQNRLTGPFPECLCKLPELGYVSLSYNQISGPIPYCIGNSTTSLRNIYLNSNRLTNIPMSLWSLKDLVVLHLSNNSLVGSLPPDFGNLDAITKVDLSRNHLSGSIPTTVGDLQKLIYLSLAFNELQGSIPESFEKMISLEWANLSNNILSGRGGFGSVYKGIFANEMVLAIKVFNLRAFKSFDTECEILRNLHHRNLTKVISSCSNMDFKALLVEYMPNGSLEQWLHSDDYYLNMIQRLDIMIDVASALKYLHHGYATVVVHSDLKPSNVLLDERPVGHVSDFGMTKLLGEGKSIAHTNTLVTMGYIAPGLVSRRCDVYSYGIMLMETFTRKKPYDEMFQENLSMRSWVCNSEDIIDATLLEPEEIDFKKKLHCVSSILELALNCTAESPNERLNMKDVPANIMKIKLEFLQQMM